MRETQVNGWTKRQKKRHKLKGQSTKGWEAKGAMLGQHGEPC